MFREQNKFPLCPCENALTTCIHSTFVFSCAATALLCSCFVCVINLQLVFPPVLFSWVIGNAARGIRDLQAMQGWKKLQSVKHVRHFCFIFPSISDCILFFIFIFHLLSTQKHYNLTNHIFKIFIYWCFLGGCAGRLSISLGVF